jgi:hypothetical protein
VGAGAARSGIAGAAATGAGKTTAAGAGSRRYKSTTKIDPSAAADMTE